jgi:hypothetical protein
MSHVHKMLVPMDGSRCSIAALAYAATLAEGAREQSDRAMDERIHGRPAIAEQARHGEEGAR